MDKAHIRKASGGDFQGVEDLKGTVKGPIFIIGTQRSGTTLLRLILNAHSQIAVPEEASFLMPLLKKKNIKGFISGSFLKRFVSYLSLNALFRLWSYDYSGLISYLQKQERISLRDLIDKIFTSYCSAKGKQIWGDKTPSFFRKVDILYSLFPDAKFIHIVRDGRDAFDSWRRADPSMDNAAVMALDWSYKLYRIEKSFSRIPERNRLAIRYEDLLEHPEETVRLICTTLGVDYEHGMLEFYKTSHDYVGEHHSKLIFRPIARNNKFKWKKNLALKESAVFELLVGRYLRKYNYEIMGHKLRFRDFLYVARSLCIGLPYRVVKVLRVKIVVANALRKGAAVDLPVGTPPKGTGDAN